MDWINNSNINWEAISAIANICVAFATLFAVIVSLYLARLNTKPRYKLSYEFIQDTITPIHSIHRFRFTNVGLVPITLKRRGVYIYSKVWWKPKYMGIGWTENKKLEHTDMTNFGYSENDINKKLISMGYKPNKIIVLVGYYQDTSDRVYKKKFIFNTFNKDKYELKLKLNNSHTE